MIDYTTFDGAVGHNWYDLDPELQRLVRDGCPPEDREWAEAKLAELGALVGERIARNADIVDANPPRLVRYDRWANEVDTVEHHPAMIDSKRALWECGYVSGFAADEAAPRPHHAGCRHRGRALPRVAGRHRPGVQHRDDERRRGSRRRVRAAGRRGPLLAGLRADDFETGIDGSMFLTERDGGRDLGHTVHCTARDIGDGRVRINGEKWFCSNIDGEAIALLARPEGATEGSAGLGLYLVPGHLEDGTRNHITMRRLKDKLGTQSVPTGEVEFHGAIGYALRAQHGDGSGSDARGLNRMMEMVNGSRFGVAMMGLGIARRCFLEATIWAHHRRVGAACSSTSRSCASSWSTSRSSSKPRVALGFECAAARAGADGDRLRRILVPAAKARLCRFGVEAASATVELYGGNGYCEDWGLTRQLRDAQCHPIWEGSENVCVLDVLRAMRLDAAHEAVLARIDGVLARGRRRAGLPRRGRCRRCEAPGTRSHRVRKPCSHSTVTSRKLAARRAQHRADAGRSRPRCCSNAHRRPTRGVGRVALRAPPPPARPRVERPDRDDRRAASCSRTTTSTRPWRPKPPPDPHLRGPGVEVLRSTR